MPSELLADELFEDAWDLLARGVAQKRNSCMRRAISTAYYAVFHLLIADFVEHWEFKDQRARLARMFSHQRMRDAVFRPTDRKKPTPVETKLLEVISAFGQLQEDRHRADYDLGWILTETDVENAIFRAAQIFAAWQDIRAEDIAGHHLLTMFGAKAEKG